MGANGDRPEWLSFKDAVAWAGVSRQRLNQAIWRGEIEAERGGPGVKARVNYQSLNHWLYERGLLTRTPEPSTTTTLERLERLVNRIDQRLEGLQQQYDALFNLVDAISDGIELRLAHLNERLDRAFTAAEEAHKIEVRRLEEKVAQLEEASKLAAAWAEAARVEQEEPSSRQVGTMATVLRHHLKEGGSRADAAVIETAVSCGFDAGTAQRCLDQLKADGRYQRLIDEPTQAT